MHAIKGVRNGCITEAEADECFAAPHAGTAGLLPALFVLLSELQVQPQSGVLLYMLTCDRERSLEGVRWGGGERGEEGGGGCHGEARGRPLALSLPGGRCWL